ncbi:deoxyribose-phosphate aldolase [Paenibacillus sp. GCM10023252]|uniref:deoxyribose-phosphate aldolase n=1 Tax=Paenibacillus sp. GCM10023252 TaxID=3252649 RepID=UPI00361C510E
MRETWKPGDSIARFIDHICLQPSATAIEMGRVCEEAVTYAIRSLNISGYWVYACKEQLSGTNVFISAVCGTPTGSTTRVKVYEAMEAIDDGADEIEMTVPVGAVKEGRFGLLSNDITAVVRAAEGRAAIKVAIQAHLLTAQQLSEVTSIAEAAGASYIQNESSYYEGSVSLIDLKRIGEAKTRGMGLIACGAILNRESAYQMLAAGADRIATRAAPIILLSDPTSAL